MSGAFPLQPVRDPPFIFSETMPAPTQLAAFAQLRALLASAVRSASAAQARARFGRASVLARQIGSTVALGELARTRDALAARGRL